MDNELMEAFFEKIQTDRVYIIESPSLADLTIERTEGLALNRALQLADFDTKYTLVSNKKELLAAFEFIIVDFYQKSGKLHAMPYIHISAHGSEAGIALTDNDFFSWTELEEQLQKINKSIGNVPVPEGYRTDISRIILTLSTCFGYYASNMRTVGKPCSFQAIIGPVETVDWSDALTAYIVFYHLANFKHQDFTKAVEMMNSASGLSDVFKIYTFMD